MRENRQSGSAGGEAGTTGLPYPDSNRRGEISARHASAAVRRYAFRSPSPGRISQLRRRYEHQWRVFQGEDIAGASEPPAVRVARPTPTAPLPIPVGFGISARAAHLHPPTGTVIDCRAC